MYDLRNYFYKQHKLPVFVANKVTLSLFCNYCPKPQRNMLGVLKSVHNIRHTLTLYLIYISLYSKLLCTWKFSSMRLKCDLSMLVYHEYIYHSNNIIR